MQPRRRRPGLRVPRQNQDFQDYIASSLIRERSLAYGAQFADPFPLLWAYRGRLALKFGSAKAALARVTLILTFSHQGRRDLSLAVRALFRAAGLS